MNRVVRIGDDRSKAIDRLAEHVEHAAQGRASDRHLDWPARVERLHAANHSFRRLHSHGADAAFTEVLLYLRSNVQRFRHRVAFAGDPHGIIDGRQMPGLKLKIQHRSDDLDNPSHSSLFFCHAFSYAVDEAPLTISIISLVMAAWRTLFMCSVNASITSPAFFVAASIAAMRAACSAAEDSKRVRRICVST